MPSPTAPASPRPSRGLVLLLAVAAGAAVGNLYWAQPLLEVIGHELDVPAGHAGWLVTATQLGYAVGILLLVPLGDVLDRRRLVPLLLTASAVTLVGSALTGPLWQAGGWVAVSTAGALLSLVGLGAWAVGRRGALVRTRPAPPTCRTPRSCATGPGARLRAWVEPPVP